MYMTKDKFLFTRNFVIKFTFSEMLVFISKNTLNLFNNRREKMLSIVNKPGIEKRSRIGPLSIISMMRPRKHLLERGSVFEEPVEENVVSSAAKQVRIIIQYFILTP